MHNETGWTGVQYSVFRIGLACTVAHVCAIRLPLVEGPPWPLLLLGIPGSIALAFGWRDRAVALHLLVLVGGLAALVDGAPLTLPQPDVLLVSGLLFLHLFVPITPFGSWDARGRIDPRGNWQRSARFGHIAWAWLCVVYLIRSAMHWSGDIRTIAVLDHVPLSAFASLSALIALTPLVGLVFQAARPALWIGLSLWQIAWVFAFGPELGTGALFLTHAFAADPAWWPGQRLTPVTPASDQPARLYYDGECGFCHRAVRFILSEERGCPAELRLRFAALQGPTFESAIASDPSIDAEELPDSIIISLEDGRLLTRSAAAIEIAARLGGLWRALALIGWRLPAAPLDAGYDAIARVRKRIFAEPKDACPILPPDLRARFDP